MQLMRSQSAGWIWRIAFSFAVLLVLSLFIRTTSVSASQTSLNLQILPIDCQFEIIDDGQNTIRYITPEECGQVVEPEPEEPSPQPSQPTITQNEPTGAPFQFAVPEEDAPISSQDESDEEEGQSADEPFEPLARVIVLGESMVERATSPSAVITASIVAVLAVTDAFVLNSTITNRVKKTAQWLSRRWRR